jgi:hypothetical protein
MKLLVYIPCHTDFDLALSQVKKVRKEFEIFLSKSKQNSVSIKIVLSVNAYFPLPVEKSLAEEICDRVIYNGEGYLGDINIANGFLIALDEKPDLLWILSANDYLVDGSIGNIIIEFINDSTIDLLVTSLDINGKYIEKQIINPPKTGLSYGLISGVVYRLGRLSPYFHNGPFTAWTGWSQLAVIQSAMNSMDGLNVKYIPFSLVYSQRERGLSEAAVAYSHSIYGALILGLIFKPSKIAARKFVLAYVFKNFYSWHLFSRKWNNPSQIIEGRNYLAWNQLIAEALIRKNSFFAYYLYRLVKLIPFEKFHRFKPFIVVKRKFDKALDQERHYK